MAAQLDPYHTLPPESLSTAKAHLSAHGWCKIPNVLTPAQTSLILSRLWEAKAKTEAQGQPTHLSQLDPNAANIRVFYLMQLDPIFRELITHPLAVELVKSVLGENFLISNFTANIARPGSKSMGLHSDMSLVVPDPWKEIWALNVIWCLHDVYRENGATLHIPGSNKYVYESDVPRTDVRKLLTPFEATAGSIIVMDGRVWHTSGANITKDQDRALLFGYYTAPHLRQQVNWSEKFSEDVRATLSEDMKTWLGLRPDANIGLRKLIYLDDEFPENRGGENGATVGPTY